MTKQSERVITEFEECIKQELLAWVEYPLSSNRCFLYPRYALIDDDACPIDPAVFPDEGCISVGVAGGSTPTDLKERFGNLVVAILNRGDILSERYINSADNCKYHSQIHPDLPAGSSRVEFINPVGHPLSTKYTHIVEVLETDLEFNKPLKVPLHFTTKTISPQTKNILIAQTGPKGTLYYGPFYCTKKLDDITLHATEEYAQKIGCYTQEDLKNILNIKGYQDSVVVQLVKSSDVNAAFKAAEPRNIYDWISDRELLNALGRILNKRDEINYTKAQIRTLKSVIDNVSAHEDELLALDDARKSRLADLLTYTDDWAHMPQDLVETAFDAISHERLSQLLLDDTFFSAFAEKFLTLKQVQDRVEQERRQIEDNNEQIRAQTQKLEEYLAQINERIVRAQTMYDDALQEAQIKNNEQIKLLEKAREDKQQELDELNTLVQRKTKESQVLDETMTKVMQDFSNKKLVAQKLLEDSLMQELINTALAPQTPLIDTQESPASEATDAAEEEKNEPAPEKPVQKAIASPALVIDTKLTGKKLVDHLYHEISERTQREYTKNDIINYMLCFTQNSVTTFAGLPGTGKTSLCNYIAGALGLLSSKAQRFVTVNVERGWTSYKDYIGYYNPLLGRDEYSNHEIFEAFKLLDTEARLNETESKQVPYVFLLDEANLSPIEHYWSPFLASCDTHCKKGTHFSIGGESNLVVPNYVRFLTTVNFDHTTETLSQRFLDRSWVVMLEPEAVNLGEEYIEDNTDYSSNKTVSYEALKRTFSPKKDALLDTDTANLLGSIIEECRNRNVMVSPRSQHMITTYIKTAQTLMDTRAKDVRFAPLDYAVSQKILPLLTGSAEQLEDLLTELQELTKPLTNTCKRLSRMLSMGGDSGFFQFFA